MHLLLTPLRNDFSIQYFKSMRVILKCQRLVFKYTVNVTITQTDIDRQHRHSHGDRLYQRLLPCRGTIVVVLVFGLITMKSFPLLN